MEENRRRELLLRKKELLEAIIEKKKNSGPIEYVEGMPEEIKASTRLKASILGADLEAKARLYQQENPELDARVEGSEITFKGKKPGQRIKFPSGFGIPSSLSEFGYDAAELGSQFLQGAAATSAAAVGGLGGALVGGPVGALAGAGSAGAAAGRGLEAARQWAGEKAGIPNNVSEKALDFETGLGAISPLLLGTGGVGKKGIKSVAAMVGRSAPAKKQAYRKALEASKYSGKGVVGQTARAIGGGDGSALSFLSGTHKSLIKNMRERGDEVSKIVKDENAISKYFQSASRKMTQIKKDAQKSYGKSLESLGGSVNISKALKPLKKLEEKNTLAYLKDVEANKALGLTGKELKKANKALSTYQPYKTTKNIVRSLAPNPKKKAEDAFDLLQRLKDPKFGNLRANKSGSNIGSVDAIRRASKQAGGKLEKLLVDKGGLSKKAKKDFKRYIKTQNTYNKLIGFDEVLGPEKYERLLEGMVGSRKLAKSDNLRSLTQSLGGDIDKQALDIATAKKYFDADLMPVPATSPTGSKMEIATKLGSAAGYGASSAAGVQGLGFKAMAANLGAVIANLAVGPKTQKWLFAQEKKLKNARTPEEAQAVIQAIRAVINTAPRTNKDKVSMDTGF